MKKIKPALFLHIQKTAGSPIVRLARLSLSSDEVMSHGDYLNGRTDDELETIVNARGKAPSDFKDFPFVSGHFGFDFARQIMDERFSLTFLRNPIERVL